jgi:putative transposase
VLLRLPYLALAGVFAAMRLLPVSDTDRDIEILALRYQPAILQRQVGKPHLTLADRAFLAALLRRLPRPRLAQLHLIVARDTVLRWHRDMLRRRHASRYRRKRPGRPPTVRSIRLLVLRLARENPSWGYRRVHGELAAVGIRVAPSAVWEICKANGVEPAPGRVSQSWAAFWRGQAQAILAADFFETQTVTGARLYIFAVIEYGTRRVQVLGATGVRVPRMKAIMERWIRSCRAELLDWTLIANQAHLMHALREYETFYNQHRLHRAALSRGTPATASPADHRTRRTRPPRHPTTRPARRHPPRIPTRRMTCTTKIPAPTRSSGRATLGIVRWSRMPAKVRPVPKPETLVGLGSKGQRLPVVASTTCGTRPDLDDRRQLPRPRTPGDCRPLSSSA